MYIPYMLMIPALRMPFSDNLFVRRSVHPKSLVRSIFSVPNAQSGLYFPYTECHRVKTVQ